MRNLVIFPADYARIFAIYEKAVASSPNILNAMAQLLTILHENSEADLSIYDGEYVSEQMVIKCGELMGFHDELISTVCEFETFFDALSGSIEETCSYLKSAEGEVGDAFDRCVDEIAEFPTSSDWRIERTPLRKGEEDSVQIRIDRHVKGAGFFDQ